MRTALMLALCAVLAAPPAQARIDDCCDVLSPDQLDGLSADLARIQGHRFDVTFLADPAEEIERVTEAMFVQRGLGPGDGLVVIFTASKRVAVHLGDDFKAHGVGSADIVRCLRSEFYPYAKLGRFDDGTRALVRELLASALGLPKARPLLPEGKTTEL